MELGDERTKYLQSTENVRKYVNIVMWGFTFFTILKIVGSAITLFIFGKYDNSLSLSGVEVMDEVVLAIIALFNLPWFVLWLIILILYSGWVHRSYTTLVKQQVQGLEQSPAWAVGWNFIPIMNLFKPFINMKEIYRATFYAEKDSIDWKHDSTPSYFLLWWIFLLIGIITFINWFQVGKTIYFLQIDTWLSIISSISFIIAGFMLLNIMKKITTKQMARFKQE